MRRWTMRSGLLAVLLLPACEGYDSGYAARPVYVAHPDYYSSPYYYAAPGYRYAPAPRSYFSFGFSRGHHRHGHYHRHHHPGYKQRW